MEAGELNSINKLLLYIGIYILKYKGTPKVPPNVFVTLAFDSHPLTFYIRYSPDPTLGAPPTCPSRFHLGLLHTILGERLGIFESYYENPRH